MLDLSSTGIEFLSELQGNQEEADTRMILHAKHVQGPFVIHADDTDVLVLLLSHSHTLGAAYMKAGRGSKTRVINIQSIKNQIAKDLPPGIDLQDFLRCLIGMHALTGCDTVSAFAGKGKSKALKMLMKNDTYVRAFMNIGISWNVCDELFSSIEEFVCDLYGKKVKNVDLLRYQMYCAKGGKIEPEALPPCRSSLKLHVTRANFQAGIWHRVIFPSPDIPCPSSHGWEVSTNSINIKWLSSKPTPEEVLELISCTCKRSCTTSDCTCWAAGLKCTDMCTLQYENMAKENDEVADNSGEEEENELD